MKTQYIVQCKDIHKRKLFYKYLISNGVKPVDNFKNQNFINNNFPFVVESNGKFWICESITCCTTAVSCGAIIDMKKYFNIQEDKSYALILKNKKL